MPKRRTEGWSALGSAAACVLTACSSQPAPPTSVVAQADTADLNTEDLRVLPGTFSTLLRDNIVATDARNLEGFGVPDARIPHPDTYWPYLLKAEDGGIEEADGIDFRWQGPSVNSPLEKYMALVAPNDATTRASAKQWEHDHHGPGLGERLNREVQNWEGHCPGWTGASMSNAPIVHPVFVQPDRNNVFAPCTEAEERNGILGCMRLEIGDINALQAEVYVDGVQPMVGRGCFTKNPTSDEFDRIRRNPNLVKGENGRGCRGLNPGTLLSLLAGRLKAADPQPFAINAQRPELTEQIWNQPVYRYIVHQYQEVNMARAIALVAKNKNGTPAPTEYVWNLAAKGFVFVDFSLLWVKEHAPTRVFISGKETTRKHRINAIIELDKDIAADPGARDTARIVGGEYLTDDDVASRNDGVTFGPNRLTVPTFVWVSSDAGPEALSVEEASDPKRQRHNPFVKPSVVKRLTALGQR